MTEESRLTTPPRGRAVLNLNYLIADTNSVAGCQAGLDLVISFAPTSNPTGRSLATFT